MNTYLSIDNAYAEWYEQAFGKPIDWTHVLRIKIVLQGQPESGRLWEIHINRILQSPELAFMIEQSIPLPLTENKYSCFDRLTTFALACTNQALADKIFHIISKKLQLPKEDKPPFAKMGLINDFNGIDVQQTDSYIKISCATYIDWLVTTHGWKELVSEFG